MLGLLDNPFWSSLTTLHRPLARGSGDALRYPADVAPFVAVARDGVPLDEALAAPGELMYAIGPWPARAGISLEDLGVVVQMVCDSPASVPPGPAIETARTADVVALAALVYPHYFRPRTTELGRYFGIYEDGMLVAMAGERMGMPGYREISAVCTHPDHVGRGLARRVLAFLATDIAAGGATPFLQVSPSNARAIHLYEQNGFRTRTELPFAAIRRS